MIIKKRIKGKGNWEINTLLFILFHNDQNPKELIDGKFCVQISSRKLFKDCKGTYSDRHISRKLKKAVEHGILKIAKKPSQRNQGYFLTFTDPYYERFFDKALKNPNHKIPQEIINDFVHNFKKMAHEVAHENNIENQQVKNISSAEKRMAHETSKKVSKSQEVKEESTVYKTISNDIDKKNVNETLSFSSSNFYRLSRVPKSEEHLRKRLEKFLTSKQMNKAVEHWKINPGKDFGWYYNAGKYDWELPVTKETIAQEHKQIGILTAKKLILRDGERLEILNTYLEFITGGTHNIPISYDDRNFLEKIENHLKKRNYSSLEELGIIVA